MQAATSTQDDSHAEPVWFGMEIPYCAEGCGTTVTRSGDVCGACSSVEHLEERLEIRHLIATVLDRGVAVTREAVAA